jgi:zinc transport system substrate-binding protein
MKRGLSGLIVGSVTGALVATATAADKPLAVTTFYPLYEFTRQVAGEHAEVVSLVPSGTEPHDWEPAPQDLIRLQSARLFVYNGAGLEPWADRLLPELKKRGVVAVRTTEGMALARGGEAGHGHEPKGAKAPGAQSAVDPHVWVDPVRAQAQVDAIRGGLAKVDPAHAAAYAANAQAYKAKLAALHQAFAAGLKQCARRDVVTTHVAFGYLTRRYGLHNHAIHGLAPEAEPSPGALADLARLAKQKKVTHVFFETLVSAKLAETLAREIGAKTLVLNPIEGLTPEEQAAGKTYLSLMEENLKNLRTALDCQ